MPLFIDVKITGLGFNAYFGRNDIHCLLRGSVLSNLRWSIALFPKNIAPCDCYVRQQVNGTTAILTSCVCYPVSRKWIEFSKSYVTVRIFLIFPLRLFSINWMFSESIPFFYTRTLRIRLDKSAVDTKFFIVGIFIQSKRNPQKGSVITLLANAAVDGLMMDRIPIPWKIYPGRRHFRLTVKLHWAPAGRPLMAAKSWLRGSKA